MLQLFPTKIFRFNPHLSFKILVVTLYDFPSDFQMILHLRHRYVKWSSVHTMSLWLKVWSYDTILHLIFPFSKIHIVWTQKSNQNVVSESISVLFSSVTGENGKIKYRIKLCNAKWAIFQQYHGENNLHFDEMLMKFALY
jgi:hypothetical protein